MMEKLSQVGRLYLKEYLILNEAMEDVFAFLNLIQENIYKNLLDRIDEIPTTDYFAWKTWYSKSKPGSISVMPESMRDIAVGEIGVFRKGKQEISLSCRDVRRDKRIATTDSLSIIIGTNNTIRRKLRYLNQGLLSSAVSAAAGYEVPLNFMKRTNYYSLVPINLDDAGESAELVTDALINCCIAINDFISVLVKQGEIDSAKV